MTYPSTGNGPFDFFGDQNDISETQFLKNAIVNHTKYGSTNHNMGPPQNLRYITHYVDTNDTLQGLALKYGCKIETIKKFNKIYSDDNNYLRSRMSLLIPIEVLPGNNTNLDCVFSPAQTSTSLVSTEAHQTSINSKDTKGKMSTHHSLCFDHKSKTCRSPNKSLSLSDSSHMNSENSKVGETVADFLIRIDSSIAKTKNQVEQMSKKGDESFIEQEISKSSRRFKTPKRTPSETSVINYPSSRTLFPFENDGNLPRVSMSNNRKKVESSLKRFEKSHEEIYEL